MSVRQRRGRQWFFRTIVRLPDGRRERIFGVPKTFGLPNTKIGAQEAERRAIERALKTGEPTTTPKEVPTFKDFVEQRWWPTYPGSVGNRKRTIEEKSFHLRCHLMPVLAEVRLDEVRGEKVAALFKALRDKGLGEKSVKNVRTTLAKILNTAVEWEVLPAAPRLPNVKVPDHAWDFFTREESERLVAVTTDAEERALLLFALHTGARWGEQRAIEWSDVDWVNRLVVIRRSMPHGTDTAAPTKSGKERRIPLTDTLAAALKGIRDLRHLQGGLVFGRRRDGGPLSLYAVRERLERACRKAGLRQIRWHDMRHSFASQLVSAGVPIRQVQDWLGHSTIMMTMRYAHLAPGSGDAIRALDAPAGRGTHVAPTNLRERI